MEFHTFCELLEHVEQFTQKRRFKISRHGCNKFDSLEKKYDINALEELVDSNSEFPEKQIALFNNLKHNETELIKKGNFYCSSCGKDGPFQISFYWNKGKRRYSIGKVVTDHSVHPFTRCVTPLIGERVLVQNVADLTEAELEEFVRLGALLMDPSISVRLMKDAFPNRDYAPCLVYYLLRRGRNKRITNGGEVMKKFEEMGLQAKSDGGLFQLETDALNGGLQRFVYGLDKISVTKSVFVQLLQSLSSLQGRSRGYPKR
eukprot:TRINITY_DN4960_c0_g1_i8.p1 TRINITY_DN4960_c0_g1~~TRINITY_DN4960_c0_g1_i8.p1  ORF type:complete len:260 (-),score=53.61 TRINITY_DN4960_c0_g1_i8:1222-2001(-)